MLASTLPTITFRVTGPLRDPLPMSGVVSSLLRGARQIIWAWESQWHKGSQRVSCCRLIMPSLAITRRSSPRRGFEAAGEGAAKILVVRDSKSKAVFACVVPTKGIDEKGFSVDALVSDVKWLGYNKVTLKSDNEPAIVKLLQEALRELRVQGLEQTLEEHSSNI